MEADQSLYNRIRSCNQTVVLKKGKDEFETYLNYPGGHKAIFKAHIVDFFNSPKSKSLLNAKDDAKALELRNIGNKSFGKDNKNAIELFTLSLCKAVVNGEAYAIALANRSAASFALLRYSDCIFDIDLCLKASYPKHLKPKVYIRKAKCLKELNRLASLKQLLDTIKAFLDSSTDLAVNVVDKCAKEVAELEDYLKSTPLVEEISERAKLPPINPNPDFLNASSSVALKYNNSFGRHVVAKEKIEVGDILFIEKPYVFVALYPDKGICHHCFKTWNCVLPCKECSDLVYCSEECRDAAWNDYHQWDCAAVKTGLFAMFQYGHLSLRTLFKASANGFLTTTTDLQADTVSYGNKDDSYPYIHKFCCHFDKLSNQAVSDMCATAAAFMAYVKTQTTFFDKLRKSADFSTYSDEEIENKLAGLFMRHCTQISSNFFLMNIEDSGREDEMLALGIFPSLSMLNHSCCSNIAYSYLDDTIIVKASKPIDIGEQIFYNYRYNDIFSNKSIEDSIPFFKCKCELCTSRKYTPEALNSYLCVKCKGPAVMNGDSFSTRNSCVCLDCKHEFVLSADILAKERIIQNYYGLFGEMNGSKYPASFDDDLTKFYQIMKVTYSPTHRLLSTFYEMAFVYYLTKEGGPNLDSLNITVQNRRTYLSLVFGSGSRKYAQAEYDMIKKLINFILTQLQQNPPPIANIGRLTLFIKEIYKASTIKLWFPSSSHVFDSILAQCETLL